MRAPGPSLDLPLVRVRAASPARDVTARRWFVAFFLGAFALRAAYLALGTKDPTFVGWYIDGFHHWQIAYLTKEIGLSHGLRLWDLGGVEYFWGTIPTLVDAAALALTFSTAMWPLQLVNMLAGSLSVAILYLIGRRYWSHAAGIALAAFFAVSPVSVLTDASAMQEPIAFLFLSLALLWFVDRPGRAGLMLGLAAASRPDYWVYSLAIIGCGGVALGALNQKPPFVRLDRIGSLLAGYLFVVVPFVVYLWIQTGNPVYPLYWNFLGNAQGQWSPPVEPTSRQLQAQLFARGLLAIALIGLPHVMLRKPSGWPVWITGLLGAGLIGYMLGISRYVVQYLDRFWLDRIMLLLYLLVAAAFAAINSRLVSQVTRGRGLATAVLILPLLALNAAWPLVFSYQDAVRGYEADAAFGARVAGVATEGTVVVPGDAVVVTYNLVQAGVHADRLLSGLYHPDYAPGASDELFRWLRTYNVRWLAVHGNDTFYGPLIANEPAHFQLVMKGVLDLYRVTP